MIRLIFKNSNRDIKPENILLSINKTLAKSNPTKAELVQLGDLGSVAYVSDPQPRSEYISVKYYSHPLQCFNFSISIYRYISTRWYRAPECLLTNGYYGAKMDIWACGCCFYEMLTLQPLFPGGDEIDQLNRIHKLHGSPSPELLGRFKHLQYTVDFPKQPKIDLYTFMSGFSTKAIDVLKKMIQYNPDMRPNANVLMNYPYFIDCEKSCGDRFSYIGKADSKTSRNSRTSRNSSTNGSNASIQSNDRKTSLDKNQVIRRLEVVQQKKNKDLERNWNRNRPSNDVKKRIMSNQNCINENQEKTVSHPSLSSCNPCNHKK